MRIASYGLLVLGLIAMPARTAEQGDARAVIARAIKAAGGEANLAKFKGQTFREKGTYYGMGKGLPYTGKYAIRWPDHFRMEIENFFTMVVAGDKGWVKNTEGTTAMGKEQLAREKQALYGGYVSTLLPLGDKAFTLTALPEAKVGDRPAVGVKVAHEGWPDVKLWFDKTTGLLIGTEQRVQPETPKAAEVNQQTYLSAFKEFDGCKIATRVVVKRDGKPYVEATLLEIKPAKLDDKVFAKP